MIAEPKIDTDIFSLDLPSGLLADTPEFDKSADLQDHQGNTTSKPYWGQVSQKCHSGEKTNKHISINLFMCEPNLFALGVGRNIAI